jgi:hypothetical protein
MYIRYTMYIEPMTMVARRKDAKSFKSQLASDPVEGSQHDTLSHQDFSIKCQPTTVKPEYTASISTQMKQMNKKTKVRTSE